LCRLSEERSKDGGGTQVIGNDTMFGQIASIMENLHLSYTEVYEVIPYQNLLMMQKDKLRICYGEKIKKTSGGDMMARRRGKK